MPLRLALALLLILAPLARGQSPAIEGADRWPVYKQVRLSVAAPAQGTGYAWLVFPPGVADGEALDSGLRYVFTGPPGSYHVVLLSIRDNTLGQALRTVTIEGTVPPPVPPPGPTPPNPTPPGPLPDGALGLIRASRDGMASIPLPAAERSTQARALAAAQRSHAAAVAAGAFASPEAILEGWRLANRDVVRAEDWRPWGEACGRAIKALYDSGRLRANQDWAAGFRELADGLESGG